jgi:hypothetical protein
MFQTGRGVPQNYQPPGQITGARNRPNGENAVDFSGRRLLAALPERNPRVFPP